MKNARPDRYLWSSPINLFEYSLDKKFNDKYNSNCYCLSFSALNNN